MSLRTYSEGILGTHVSWAEFEENLTRSLRTTARFGTGRSAVDIGEGNGFASRCALITCDWQGEEAEYLPKRVVLKMGSCLSLIAFSSSLPAEQNLFRGANEEQWRNIEKGVKDIHNIECDAYDYLEQLGEGLAVPTRFYSRQFSKENVLTGQICLEYVEGSRMMHFYDVARGDLMHQIARALGRIQAASTRVPVESELILTKDVFAENNKSMPKKKYVRYLCPLKRLEPSLTEAVESMEHLLSDYYGSTLPSTIHRQMNIPPVLVHGDVRTENILVDERTGDLLAIIDWQCAHLGVAVEDLLRISFFAQTAEERRASAPALLAEMYDAFVEGLEGAPAPISLKQLSDIYDLLFPHCAIYFATVGLGVVMPAHKPRPGEADGEKRRKYAVIVEKARGVLEDIAFYHEKNKASGHRLVWNYDESKKEEQPRARL